MEDRGGAPPLNNQVASEDAQVAQQVTSNQQARYGQDMDIDSVSSQNVETSANSGAQNHSHNQSHIQTIHTHPHMRYSQNGEGNVQGRSASPVSQGVPAAATATQGRQNNHQPRSRYSQNVQPRHGQHNSRKRAYEPDFDYVDAYPSADQKEQRMGVQRLPLAGELLQQEPFDKVRYMNNGPKYKDQLELMGGNQSMVNWLAPDQRAKSTYGLQFVAKVATDDESLAALVKTIQLEARRQGSPIVNLWFQCQDPKEQRFLLRTVASTTYNQLAPSYNVSRGIQRCTACAKPGHRVRECPRPGLTHYSISMCSVCDTQDHIFDACSEVRKRLPLFSRLCGPDTAHQEPDITEAHKWFGEMLINRRVNKPPVRTALVSWTAVAQYLYHHAKDFKFHGAPWSLAFTRKMVKAYRDDEIFNGRTHWRDWDPRKGDKDEDLPADPLCQSLEVIVQNLQNNRLGSERFVAAATGKALNKNVENTFVEHLKVDEEPGGHLYMDLAEAHAVGGVPPKPAKPTVEESDQQSRERTMPIRIKKEPDTESSGITIPTKLVKVPTELERRLHFFDDDDEVDPVDFIFQSMPPTKSHKAVIQPVPMRPQALPATARRLSPEVLSQQEQEQTAVAQTGDNAAAEGDDYELTEMAFEPRGKWGKDRWFES